MTSHVDEAEVDKDSNAVSCPSCGARIKFKVRVKVGSVELAGAAEETPQAAVFVMQLRALGLLAAFERAVEDVMQGSVPKRVEKYLGTWIRKAATTRVQREALQTLKAEFISQRVDVYAKDGIAAAVVDGVLRCFIPRRLLDNAEPGKLARKPAAFPEGLRLWVRENKIVVAGGQSVFFSSIQHDALIAEAHDWRF
jgi:DNA-directed RNA polymerase subunit RPC12/RpoP